MDHQAAQEQFMAYLDGRLSPPGRATLEQHLSTCPGCQRDLSSLRDTDTWLARSIGAAASQAEAPRDAWDRFAVRLGEASQANNFQRNRGHRSMQRTVKRNPLMGMMAGFAAAAIVLIGVGIAAVVLLSGRQQTPGEVAEVNATSTLPGAAPGVTLTEPGTLSPEEQYMTARPQSGGGSGQPDGSSGEGLPPVWQGTVQSIDPAAGTITLGLDGQVARIMPFTQIRVDDITWDGAIGSVEDIHPGDRVQVDLLDVEPSPPFANIIWVARPVDVFYESMAYEKNGGTITSLDPATGIFTVDVWGDRQFRYDAATRMLIDDDTLDGTPIGPESLQIGQMLSFVALTDQGEPNPVVLIMVEIFSEADAATLYKGTITAIDGNVITAAEAASPTNVYTLDLGPAGSQGISFAVGDVIYFRGYHDPASGTFVTRDVIKLGTGEWVRVTAP